MAPYRRSQNKKSSNKAKNATTAATVDLPDVNRVNRALGKQIKAAEAKIKKLEDNRGFEIRNLTEEFSKEIDDLKGVEMKLTGDVRNAELVAAEVGGDRDEVQETVDALRKEDWKRMEEKKYSKEFQNAKKTAMREKEEKEKIEVYERQVSGLKELADSENVNIWRLCETCGEEYTSGDERSPRLLACSHTFCFRCIKNLAKPDGLQCPIDGAVTFVKKADLGTLKKNYFALHM